jgi:hypothetical protein
MGKKDPSKKRKRVDFEDQNDSDNIVDPELEQELAAVKAIRYEKTHNESDNDYEKPVNEVYNRDGILKCLSDIETKDLPFIQTMEINEFEFPHTNELDDMEREVSLLFKNFFVFHKVLMYFSFLDEFL